MFASGRGEPPKRRHLSSAAAVFGLRRTRPTKEVDHTMRTRIAAAALGIALIGVPVGRSSQSNKGASRLRAGHQGWSRQRRATSPTRRSTCACTTVSPTSSGCSRPRRQRRPRSVHSPRRASTTPGRRPRHHRRGRVPCGAEPGPGRDDRGRSDDGVQRRSDEHRAVRVGWRLRRQHRQRLLRWLPVRLRYLATPTATRRTRRRTRRRPPSRMQRPPAFAYDAWPNC